MHVRVPSYLGTWVRTCMSWHTSPPNFSLSSKSSGLSVALQATPIQGLSPLICPAGLDQAGPICRLFTCSLMRQLLLFSLHSQPHPTTTSAFEVLVTFNSTVGKPGCAHAVQLLCLLASHSAHSGSLVNRPRSAATVSLAAAQRVQKAYSQSLTLSNPLRMAQTARHHYTTLHTCQHLPACLHAQGPRSLAGGRSERRNLKQAEADAAHRRTLERTTQWPE